MPFYVGSNLLQQGFLVKAEVMHNSPDMSHAALYELRNVTK